MRILVVDDDMVSRKKMEKILQEFGECFLVESGQDAIKVFTEAWAMGIPFDLITLDIGMPDISGIDVLKHIRQIEKDKAIAKDKLSQIMMVTSHADQEVVVGSLNAGCNTYIVKPFERGRVLEKVENLGFSLP
ncbi:MAG: response regulator [Proteobacteria bacterium]|nr:response regulator [Pseudomonadota bacterium]